MVARYQKFVIYQKSKLKFVHLIQENTNIRKLKHTDQYKHTTQVRVERYRIFMHLLVFIL